MTVLVGCECSSTVTSAFRSLGIDAFSCDISPCYGSLPEFHIQGDLRDVYDYVNPDLFIAHPPCTYLSNVGSPRLYSKKNGLDPVRYDLGIQARSFFNWCLSRPAPMICIENPVPNSIFRLPKPSQIIQPWYFGDPYTKRTCLWLKGLPPLSQTNIVRPIASWVNVHTSSRLRSKTFDGVARAMAAFWSGDLVNYQYSLWG